MLDVSAGDPAGPTEDPLGGKTSGPPAVPPKIDPLTGRRRRLYEALTEIDPRLAAVYLGAMLTLGQTENKRCVDIA